MDEGGSSLWHRLYKHVSTEVELHVDVVRDLLNRLASGLLKTGAPRWRNHAGR